MPPRISYAQNGEDVRVWRAFSRLDVPTRSRTYIDVGANFPWELSITAALYLDGWDGLLVEADPQLAAELVSARPRDLVINAAAADQAGTLTFHRVPGTGLGTLDPREAEQAASRGFDVEEVSVPTRTLSQMWDEHLGPDAEVQFLSIDVEGAEAQVITGWDRTRHRPWIVCIEAVEPGSRRANHEHWSRRLEADGYRLAAFDGVNRWYVAEERADLTDSDGYSLTELVAIPVNAFDRGIDGWVSAAEQSLRNRSDRSSQRNAWQRALQRGEQQSTVPTFEYERQIEELRSEVVAIRGSRAYRLFRKGVKPVKRVRHEMYRVKSRLPGPIARAVTKRRLLRHVSANMRNLIHPAYLGEQSSVTWEWSTPLPIPVPTIPPDDLHRGARLSDLGWAQEWSNTGPWDADELLDDRMDNRGDEVGRTQAALRTRLRLAALSNTMADTGIEAGGRVLIDVRSLQTAAFGGRGIGRFARAALLGAVDGVDPARVDLLVDPALGPLPDPWPQTYRLVDHIPTDRVAVDGRSDRLSHDYSVLVQPSPMTHSPEPLLPVLMSDAHSIALVFDFIPRHYPPVYLSSIPQHCEYAAQLDALRCYDEYVCISEVTQRELSDFLQRDAAITVAWPTDVGLGVDHPRVTRTQDKRSGPIVVMTGDEPRKNTFTGLAGIAAATIDEDFRWVQVIGMAGLDDRVHHWSIAAMMRPGEATTVGRLTDDELTDTLARASLVVVPSFDEGLSLPVIEALAAGTPVVASDIPAHRELLGRGSFLADPKSPADIARAITRHRGSITTWRKQAARLARHNHRKLGSVIRDRVTNALSAPASAAASAPSRRHEYNQHRSRIALVTPWAPQPTGVGDFSTTIGIELARHVDLTVITTSDADVQGSVAGLEDPPRIAELALNSVLADPGLLRDFDHVIAVLGNSHFHLPILELTRLHHCAVIAHDTRMVEFYLARDGRGPVEQLMLRTNDSSAPQQITPSLDEQIADMRLLQNAAMWEVAHRAHPLILHSASAAPVIERQTGVRARLLPFANQRVPERTPTEQDRRAARERLGFDPSALHLATFGYVDLRTKLTDVVLEGAGWLTLWGHRVHLHVVGRASADDQQRLQSRAQEWNLAGLTITGFTDEETFRDYLLAVDLGVQLRIGPLLGVSGPLSDLAAFGTRAVASEGLCIDVDAPDYITPLPQAISPTMLAQAIEQSLAQPRDDSIIEAQREAYLADKTAEVYVRQLLTALGEVAS